MPNYQSTLNIQGQSYTYYDLKKLKADEKLHRLPFSLKILLENLLRTQDGESVTEQDIQALLNWDPKGTPSHEIAFTPSRVILQDFTGVPAVVDLAAMRQAMQDLGDSADKINPLSPVELVIDHSVMVDEYGNPKAFAHNTALEFQRNQERYRFLRWGQEAFNNFKVVPPGTGIVHQVNLEYLARVVFEQNQVLYPDTLVGTDSHTTMINGLGVLGWGVGGIEAEAAMLGQPITMLIPQVIGFELTGELAKGATATDLVLAVVEQLRQKGVVGKFVEFFGDGLDHLPLADRATIGNMAPEFGATCGIFPIDEETLKFLALTGRQPEEIEKIKAYAQAQGLFREANSPKAQYTDVLTLNLAEVEPAIAGPSRPQDRIPLSQSQDAFQEHLQQQLSQNQIDPNATENVSLNLQKMSLTHGDVVIAAITSCTNTSNPAVMLAAGLLAQKALEKGVLTQPWVKTSLAPGSQVVMDYLEKANVLPALERQGFNLVGYGCTTCIGNSGPLPEPIADAVQQKSLTVCAVLSGNRNFEGRIHPQVRFSYLASPPLVVAYALAGTMNIDFDTMPIAKNAEGESIYLRDIWPSEAEITQAMAKITPEMFSQRYQSVFDGDDLWKGLDVKSSELYQWDDDSTYVKLPPYFENIQKNPAPLNNIESARILALLGDSVTTDHISPAGAIAKDSPAGQYLQDNGIAPKDFNSYGSRRGNHEVMMRGTFANIRLRNLMVEGKEGGFTRHQPSDEMMTIFDAAMRYQQENCPLIILAGKEYGTGSSRDWAAKGTLLLGVKAVIAESFERIHRSNLIGMGVLPLQFQSGETAKTLNLTGKEQLSIDVSQLSPQGELSVVVDDGQSTRTFSVLARIDTPKELQYYQHGGILHYVLRQM